MHGEVLVLMPQSEVLRQVHLEHLQFDVGRVGADPLVYLHAQGVFDGADGASQFPASIDHDDRPVSERSLGCLILDA